jgi:DNA-binding MarR family transcriptional regulator
MPPAGTKPATLRHHQCVEPTETPDRSALSGLHTALVALAQAVTSNRAHARMRRATGIPVDRASLAVLRALTGSPSPLRMGELADVLMVQTPHVAREVRRLEGQGLVATRREAGDQRARRAEVTEDGREAVVRAEAHSKLRLANALKDFSTDELQTTAAVLNRIIDSFRHQDSGAGGSGAGIRTDEQ